MAHWKVTEVFVVRGSRARIALEATTGRKLVLWGRQFGTRTRAKAAALARFSTALGHGPVGENYRWLRRFLERDFTGPLQPPFEEGFDRDWFDPSAVATERLRSSIFHQKPRLEYDLRWSLVAAEMPGTFTLCGAGGYRTGLFVRGTSTPVNPANGGKQ